MYSVFLAEDEPWALMTLKSLIDWNENGFVISGEADDGISAWERILRIRPDLILSDIRMPGLDGLSLLKKIREGRLDTEVVFISGYSDFDYARTAIQYGCMGYLGKPVDEDELEECLERVRIKLQEKRGEENKEADEDGYQSENVLVKKIMSYIEENYNKGISQQKIAKEFGLSESYISNLIKKNTGKSYNEHILEARIRKAQEMLRMTNDSIEEIAEKAGYGDYFYFNKVYKKATGMTPAAYRKSL